MSEIDIYEEIGKYSSLLKKYFDGELTPGERERLAAWLWSDRGGRDLLCRLRDKRLARDRYEQARKIDARQEFELLLRRYSRLRKRRQMVWWYYAAAVAVFFLVGTGGWFLAHRFDPVNSVEMTTLSKVQAVLKTADGQVIQIAGNTSLEGTDGFQVKDSLKELVYTNDSSRGDVIRYHQLEVPRGGEYKLTLADGTLVRLNSESLIRFPERFSGKAREVEIRGNVYLDVAKDSLHPFVVRAGAFVTKVLGTHFGMRAYADETEWTTTLAEGRVIVLFQGDSLLLHPGQQAYLAGAGLKSRCVDVEQELSWVKGVFMFKHERLERVVNELSRWYDVKFLFEEEGLKDDLFTGCVSRDIGIDEILSLIERMNIVKFEKGKDYILIKTNDKVKT